MPEDLDADFGARKVREGQTCDLHAHFDDAQDDYLEYMKDALKRHILPGEVRKVAGGLSSQKKDQDERALAQLVEELPAIDPAYVAFSQLLEVNGTVSKTVCMAQLQLCGYGLVLVCLKLINDDSDQTSIMGMQMLSAILDGESGEVRASAVEQFSKPVDELFVNGERYTCPLNFHVHLSVPKFD